MLCTAGQGINFQRRAMGRKAGPTPAQRGTCWGCRMLSLPAAGEGEAKQQLSHGYVSSILLMSSAAEQLWGDSEKVLPALCQAETLSCLGTLEVHFRAVLGSLCTGGGESVFYVYCSRYQCSKWIYLTLLLLWNYIKGGVRVPGYWIIFKCL